MSDGDGGRHEPGDEGDGGSPEDQPKPRRTLRQIVEADGRGRLRQRERLTTIRIRPGAKPPDPSPR